MTKCSKQIVLVIWTFEFWSLFRISDFGFRISLPFFQGEDIGGGGRIRVKIKKAVREGKISLRKNFLEFFRGADK